VTSERLTITSLTEHCIHAVTDDGRHVEITGHGIDRDHLDYGYAVTVHRAQGLTCDRAHILASGGGRELAYVAMSRAKEHTIIHTTAPDRAAAMDVLTEEWGAAADEQWITETSARSGTETPPHGHPRPVQVQLTTMNEPELRHRLRTLEHDLQCLHLGVGRWNDTPEGAAARSLLGARDRLTNAERLATAPDSRRRDRRAAVKSLDGLAISLAAAERTGTQILAPTASALRDEISAVRQELNHRETAELRRTLDRLQIPGPAVEQHLSIGL
jgi:hypothetical protein